jgi:cyclophilin family peptidyl-prolyl cis-trans isomerase/HEAT repeat protein
MRRLLAPAVLMSLVSLSACNVVRPVPPPLAAPPPTVPSTAATPPPVHGFTPEEEATILRLEDRREYDPTVTAAWLSNPNSLHRARMALALARIGPATFVDKNGNGEKDPGETQAGVAELAPLVADPSDDVRRNAAFALGEIEDPAAIETLFTLTRDQANADVAAEAVEALSKLAASVPLQRFSELTTSAQREGVRARAVRFLFRWKSDAASAVAAAALDANDVVIRREGAYSLSRRAYAPARPALELLLGDADTLTRAYAARALGAIAEKPSLPRLIAALDDPHPWVRTNAAGAIGRIAAKDPSGLNGPTLATDAVRIMTVLDDADPGTRASIIEALGYYALYSSLARKRLTEVAANGSRWERELATGALARQFGDAADSTIPTVLASGSPWERVRVAEASESLKLRGAAIRRQLVHDSEAMVRAAALGAIPDERVDAEIDTIRAALSDPDPIVRSGAIDKYSKAKSESDSAKIALLTRAMEDGSRDKENDARLSALIAIAAIDYPQREATLRGFLADRDPVIRRVAADQIVEKLKRNRPAYTPLPVDLPMSDYLQVVYWSRTPHSATIHMARGNIELQLLTQDAPMTTWNFAGLAQKNYFDSSSFMRVVPNFVIQGGDPRNDMSGGPGYAIRDEINLQKYTRGAVGMALSGPDTGGSQFFVAHSPQPHLDGGYTIFARVVGGMSGVVDQTERGDKVTHIAIDERPSAAGAAAASEESVPLPVEIGPTTPARLLSIVPEYRERRASYAPDVSELEYLAAAIHPGDRIEVFLGTWCSDSQREVPKLLKILEVMQEKYNRSIPVSFVAVDRSKTKPEAAVEGHHLEKVATFIYYRGGSELGRIVERPTGLLEDDLLAIAATR